MTKRTWSILTDVLVVAGASLIVGVLPRLLGTAAPEGVPMPPPDEGEEAEF